MYCINPNFLAWDPVFISRSALTPLPLRSLPLRNANPKSPSTGYRYWPCSTWSFAFSGCARTSTLKYWCATSLHFGILLGEEQAFHNFAGILLFFSPFQPRCTISFKRDSASFFLTFREIRSAHGVDPSSWNWARLSENWVRASLDR